MPTPPDAALDRRAVRRAFARAASSFEPGAGSSGFAFGCRFSISASRTFATWPW
jgi:hypothetical protein